MTDYAKDEGLGCPGQSMEGINFGWFAVWVPSPDWLCRILELCDIDRRLGEAAEPEGRECGQCPDFALNTLVFKLQLRKITENLSQDSRRILG